MYETLSVVEVASGNKNKDGAFVGVLFQDDNIKLLQTFDKVLSVLATVNTKLVQTVVNELRNTNQAYKDNDKFADALITLNTARSALAGAISELGGPLAVPLEVVGTVAQWAFQTELAYSLGYVYTGKVPVKDSFKNHLLVIFAGGDSAKKAVRDATKDAADAKVEKMMDDAKDKITEAILESETFKKIKAKVIAKLTDKLGEEFVKKAGKVITKIIPIANVVYGAIDAGLEANKFGKEAREFYKPTVTPAQLEAKAKAEADAKKAADAKVKAEADIKKAADAKAKAEADAKKAADAIKAFK